MDKYLRRLATVSSTSQRLCVNRLLLKNIIKQIPTQIPLITNLRHNFFCTEVKNRSGSVFRATLTFRKFKLAPKRLPVNFALGKKLRQL